jgi:hypothetical protein
MDNRFNGPHINSESRANKDKPPHYLTMVAIGPMSEFQHVSATSKEMKDIIKSLKNKNKNINIEILGNPEFYDN